jgi:hypothetical protein
MSRNRHTATQYPASMAEDAAAILHLAQRASLAAAADEVATMPAAQAKRLALALGASKLTANSRRGASEWLVQQASWAIKYRAMYDQFKPAFFK